MSELKSGDTVEVCGSEGRTYTITNSKGDYSCSCMGWKTQDLPKSMRTCKHLKTFRGEREEYERITKEPDEPDVGMPRVLTTAADISAAIERLRCCSRLWLDTEIAEYWDAKRRRVSLIQALADGVPPNTREAIILDVIDQPSLVSLFVDRIMKEPSIQKVFHNAGYDLDYLGCDQAVNVFCTREESKVLPESRVSLPKSKSLKSLHEHFGFGEVDKTGQDSDWKRRPLARWQLKYAALDCTQLRMVHLKLIEMRKWLDDTNAWPGGVPLPSRTPVPDGSRKRSGPSSTSSRAGKRSSPSAEPRAFELFRDGASLEEVQAETNRARRTVVDYLVRFIEQEGLTDPTPWIAIDESVFSRVGAASCRTGTGGLKPIFEALEGEVDYDRIKIVLACMRGNV